MRDSDGSCPVSCQIGTGAQLARRWGWAGGFLIFPIPFKSESMTRRTLWIGLPLVTVLASTATSKKDGILPSTSLTLTRTASSSCGSCHGGSPGGPTVRVTPSERVMRPGQSISVQIATSGGPSGSRGGFAADVTGGTLVAGSNTRVSSSGAAIAHSDSRARTWSFGYRAPTQTGPVEFYTVANAVNGDGKTSGDRWAFHGSNPSATTSTPVRFFVNAPGVVPIGKGCSDGYGNVGVFGASQTPTVGNSGFRFEAVGLPPSARLMFMLGVQKNAPSVELTAMGAPTCFLHTDIAISIYFTTTAGNAERSEGRFSLPAPIPNNTALKGFFFRSQIAVLDGSPRARKLPVVFTNGLGVTIQ